MTAKSRGIIRLTETFPACAERVFDAWLSPEKVARWFPLDAEEQVTRVEIDARVGGSIRIVTNRAGYAVEHTGKYLEMVRPNRLSFTINSSAFAETARVTVLIEPRGAGCFLTLTSRIEQGPLRALTPLAALAPFRAEKAVRPRWPAVEPKAMLSLGFHLAMLPLLPIVLREPELPPAVASPTPLAFVTVDLAAGGGVKLPGRLDVRAVAQSAAAALAPIQRLPAAAARPVTNAKTSRTALPVAQPRTVAPLLRALHVEGASDSSPGPRPLNVLGAPSHATDGPHPMTSTGGTAGEEGDGLHQRMRAASAQVGLPPLGTICSGTISFSPDRGLGTYYGDGLGTYRADQEVPVQARFFRDQQGSPWVQFTLWPGAPWNLPVTLSGSEIRWTGLSGNGYALRPAENNHLTGFAGFDNDYAAKIDFTCAVSDAHPT
jgi:uncharacterized protein YndB with AHSA1/START domain